MKIQNPIKIITLSLVSILLLSTNIETENSIEDEVQKLFNGIPVHEGIQEIVKKSNLKFDYGKTISILGSHENWVTHLNKFEYLESPTKEIKLELSQGSEDKKNACYTSSLRLFYQNEEIMAEEFFRIKEKFEILGEKVDTETVLTEDYIMKRQSVIVYFNKEKQIPYLGFSFSKDEEYNEYQVFVHYQNCLKN